MADDAEQPILKVTGLSKSFGVVRALSAIDFSVRPGEVHALVGENGAGKSTLIRVLTGVHRPDAGHLALDGRTIVPRSPLHAETLGIACVHQEVMLIPRLSAAENIVLGREPTRFGLVNRRAMHARARAALDRLGVSFDVTRDLEALPIASRQLAAIARALDVSARLLILDEPTASLDRGEVTRLLAVLRRLRESGIGIVFVSHFLEQVYAIADRVTILRDGRLVGTHPVTELPRVSLVSLMIGRPLAEPTAPRSAAETPDGAPPRPAPVLSARGLGRRGAIAPFDLDLEPGRTLGLAGLLGSGRSEAARLLFGLERADSGTISRDGRPVTIRSPRGAVARGLAFTPEDRRAEGLIPDLSVRENIVLAMQASRGIWRRLPSRRQHEIAGDMIRRLAIRCTGPEQPVRTLSGGNQQKVVLARWLILRPRVLILDEPTRGVDVGAREQIESLIGSLRDEGLAVLLITAELDHLVRAADRLLVLRDRRVVARLDGASRTEDTVMHAIADARHDEDHHR
ncbi:MAG: sugar ABC transporter ATP-binding protein [Phycisphaerales bacterium]